MTIPSLSSFTFNPVALKELRQLTRSRIISLLLVGCPILMFIIFALALSAVEHGKSPIEIACGNGLGEAPFYTIAAITGIIACIVIPLVSSIKTAYEYTKGRMGLEFTTTLTPIQIITGKLLAPVIISTAVIAVSMPFFTITYLMRGVPLSIIFFLPVLFIFASAVLTAALLPFATATSLPSVMRLILMSGISIFSISMGIATWEYVLNRSSTSALAVYLGIPLVMIATIILMRSFAAAQISPPFVDGHRSLRLTVIGTLVLSAPVIYIWNYIAWCVIWSIALLILFTKSAVYPHSMPRVVIAKAPKSLACRLLAYPFATGPYSGQLFSLLLFAVPISTIACCCNKSEDVLRYLFCVIETITLIILITSLIRKIGSARLLKASIFICSASPALCSR